MQCTENSKIRLSKSYFYRSESNINFIRGHEGFSKFHAHRVIIGLPCGQGQLSRIWKVQLDWLSMGKECCSRWNRHSWGGMKYEFPKNVCAGG